MRCIQDGTQPPLISKNVFWGLRVLSPLPGQTPEYAPDDFVMQNFKILIFISHEKKERRRQ